MYPTVTAPVYHSNDRNFFLVMIIIMWMAIISGFGYDIYQRIEENKLYFPLIVHLHALAFTAWLFLITTQIFLVRTNKVALHKKLGIAGAVLAVIMVVLGVATTLIMTKQQYETSSGDLHFLSITLGDMLLFGTIAAAGINLRNKQPEGHKRLMLFATLLMSDAGYGRWLSVETQSWFGSNAFFEYSNFKDGFLPYFGFEIFFTLLTLLAIGFYDLITRGRLYAVYVWALIWYIAVTVTGSWLYYSTWWDGITKQMIGVE